MTESTHHNVLPYEAARAVLQALHATYLEQGNRLWSMSVSKDGRSNFAHLKLDDGEAWKAVQILVSRGLVEYRGTRAFVITDYGVTACDHPDSLDHELPLPIRSRAPLFSLAADEQDFGALDEITELLADERLASIVRRDVSELKKAITAGLPKCVALLAGSILEGVLIDILDRNRALASTYLKKRKFPDDASLSDLCASPPARWTRRATCYRPPRSRWATQSRTTVTSYILTPRLAARFAWTIPPPGAWSTS